MSVNEHTQDAAVNAVLAWAAGQDGNQREILAARVVELTEERDWLKVELDRLGKQMAAQSARHAAALRASGDTP